MSGNSLFSIAKAFNLIFGAKTEQRYEDAPDAPEESLIYASNKLERGICPQCDRVASIGCVEVHDDCSETYMCSKCGANYRFDYMGKLRGFTGFNVPIHEKYLQDIDREVESIRRQAAVDLEHRARKAA